jgi:hypothetical protein
MDPAGTPSAEPPTHHDRCPMGAHRPERMIGGCRTGHVNVDRHVMLRRVMKEVRFAEYRRYEARRVEVSNAMMALLAGAGMASHLLQLTRGSRHLLPEVLPRDNPVECLGGERYVEKAVLCER